jgi:hypothetical protein
VGDEHGAALKVVEDLESSGYEPSMFLACGEDDLGAAGADERDRDRVGRGDEPASGARAGPRRSSTATRRSS